jgi:hypothetical protein
MDRRDGALDIYQIVLAQIRCPFIRISIAGKGKRVEDKGQNQEKMTPRAPERSEGGEAP